MCAPLLPPLHPSLPSPPGQVEEDVASLTDQSHILGHVLSRNRDDYMHMQAELQAKRVELEQAAKAQEVNESDYKLLTYLLVINSTGDRLEGARGAGAGRQGAGGE